ncbi:hypothetical protein SE92_33315 [Bradyrhizobium sp. AT1]|nr:hypothetical protein SE92_33315 [Bradyrhizobium sp. AT1]
MQPTIVRDLPPTSGRSAVLQADLSILQPLLARKGKLISILAFRPTSRSICGICKRQIACLEPVAKTCGS